MTSYYFERILGLLFRCRNLLSAWSSQITRIASKASLTWLAPNSSITEAFQRFNGLFFIASVENTWGAQIWNLPDDWMHDLCFIATLSRRESNCRTRIEESHRKQVFNCGAFVSSFHFYQITRSSSWTCMKINV